jgi:hypothetical protein
VHSNIGGGVMRTAKKVLTKKSKKPVKASQAVKARCLGRTSQIRVSHENKAILELIQEKLEAMYDNEMSDLGIKSLTIDGAITQVLMTALIEWSLPQTMLEEDSSYLNVKKLADYNYNQKEA